MPNVIKRCPKGHLYDSDTNDSCPYCNPPSTQKRCPNDQSYDSNQNEPHTRFNHLTFFHSSRFSWIVAGVCALTSIFFFTNWMNANARYERAWSDLHKELKKSEEKLEMKEQILAEINRHYGYGSSSYYAAKPVVILDINGSSEFLPIYCDLSVDIYRSIYDAATMRENYTAIKAEWRRKWENHWDGLTIVPGGRRGFYIIRFSDQNNSTTFDVLVIVK